MTRMAARRVYFEKKLPMFVLLVPLLLAKCVSGDEPLTAAESSLAGFEGVSGILHNAELTHSRQVRAAAQTEMTSTTSTPASIIKPMNTTASATNPSTVITTKNLPAETKATTPSAADSMSKSPTVTITTDPTAATTMPNSSTMTTTTVLPGTTTSTISSKVTITTDSSEAMISTNSSKIANTTVLPGTAISINSPTVTITTNLYAETKASTPPPSITSPPVNLSTTNTTNIHPDAAYSNKTTLDTGTTAIPSAPRSSDATSSPSIATKPDSETSSEATKPTRAVQRTSGIPTTESALSTKSKYPTELSTLPQGNVSSTKPESDVRMSTESSGKNSISSVAKLKMKPCKNNNDCNKTLHLMCNVSSGFCTCTEGYSPSSLMSCVKKLGDPCDENCDAANSICGLVGDKNMCICEDGLIASVDGNFCYGKALMYFDHCNHNANCTDLGPNVECKNFSCVCKENYIRRNMACMEPIDRLDARCNDETQVCYKAAEGDYPIKRKCLGGFCRCDSANGFVPQDGLCKKKISLLGAPCEASTHVCHLEDDGDNQTLHCQNGICKCKDTFLLDNKTCKKKIGTLGEICSPDAEICYAETEGYGHKRQCTNGTCQCKSAFIEDNGMCKQKISLLGAPCNATSDVCFLQEDGDQQKIHCKDGICQCKAEFALSDKKCQKEKYRGGVTQNFGPSAWILLTVVTVEILR